LGKKELRTLISWWKAFRDDQRKKNEAEETKIVETNAKSEHDSLSDDEKELEEISKQIDEIMVSSVYYHWFSVK